MPDDQKPDAPLPHSMADDFPDLVARKKEAAAAADTSSGQSFTPGLVEVPNSKVPGTSRSHVMGPQQMACDPVAAGLDVTQRPMTTQEDRVITRTGVVGSGARPGNAVGEAAKPVSDGSSVPAQTEAEAQQGPGPNSAPGGEKPKPKA